VNTVAHRGAHARVARAAKIANLDIMSVIKIIPYLIDYSETLLGRPR
jgi:hypothetical protein